MKVFMKKHLTLLCLLTPLSLMHAGPQRFTLKEWFKIGRCILIKFQKLRVQEKTMMRILSCPKKTNELLEALNQVKKENKKLMKLCEELNPDLKKKRTTQ